MIINFYKIFLIINLFVIYSQNTALELRPFVQEKDSLSLTDFFKIGPYSKDSELNKPINKYRNPMIISPLFLKTYFKPLEKYNIIGDVIYYIPEDGTIQYKKNVLTMLKYINSIKLNYIPSTSFLIEGLALNEIKKEISEFRIVNLKKSGIISGPIKLELKYKDEANWNKKDTISFNLKTYASVLIADKEISPNQSILLENLKTNYDDITKYNDRVLLVGDDLDILETRSLILKNNPIPYKNLKEYYHINKGDVVRVYLTNSKINIEIDAISTNNGRINETITLKTPTNKNIKAVVTGIRLAKYIK